MPKNAFLKSVTVVTLAAFSSGCVSTTIIKSNPPGAKVYVDGTVMGKTPYQMTDTKTIFSSTSIRLDKPGFEPMTTIIPRAEEPDIGPIVGGICLGVSIFGLGFLLWAAKYKPEHSYELEPKSGTPRGGVNVPSTSAPDTM